MVATAWLTQALCLFSGTASALTLGDKKYTVTDVGQRDLLQDLVTFDKDSLLVRGERIMFYSGEFHPWRLPVPGLWLDVFQKIKALGYTGVSFYVNWALLEGNPGHFSAEGVFSYEQFFAAAAEAGIYLLARPGPYINAEVSGGGFPGWLGRESAILRTNMTGYIEATSNYINNIGKIIADAQITNGGPVVLFQAENEYTYGADFIEFPDVEYFEILNKQYRNTGLVVPFVNNEADAIGLFVPGEPGGPDIYGHDDYPVGFDCSDPSNWTTAVLPTDFEELHQEQSPNTPYTIPEYQGGALDGWSGVGLDGCAALTGPEFERIFYKDVWSFGIKILNLYMTFGGTNWGNLGQPSGYTSYDYGAVLRENRMVDREKYSEAKLLAHFIAASPAYLTAVPGNETNTTWVSTGAITTTPVVGERTGFFVTRQSDWRSTEAVDYSITLPSSAGNITIPQLGGSLTMNGRDSKVHVTNYDVRGMDLLYSSADILTHNMNGHKRVLILYGGAGETHEFALPSSSCGGRPYVEGGHVKIQRRGGATVVQWVVTPERKVLHYDDLEVYLLWRNEALTYWSIELEAPASIGNYTAASKDTVIVKGGYLMRSASMSHGSLHLVGDVNATTDIEIIAGYASHRHRNSRLYFNGEKLHAGSEHGRVCATIHFETPELSFPDLTSLDWKYIDSLPEIHDEYDDSTWTLADQPSTGPKNLYTDPDGAPFELMTPTSLISSDYGYNTGSLIYRGHFVATGSESTLNITTAGGFFFGHSIWLNGEFVGSYGGESGNNSFNAVYDLPSTLSAGVEAVVTVLIDHMGIEPNWTPGFDFAKTPRGVMDYSLDGHDMEDITWRITGNLGGESYPDQTRGPLNEGAFFAQRQGYHYPEPPSSEWESRGPLDGQTEAGVGFYTAAFELDMPHGYDIPLSFVFNSSSAEFSSSASDVQMLSGTEDAARYRAEMFINGWQFGVYVNNLGPQTRFAVPEGILDYHGSNTVAITLWAQDAAGASLSGFELKEDGVVATAFARPELIESPVWEEREGAY